MVNFISHSASVQAHGLPSATGEPMGWGQQATPPLERVNPTLGRVKQRKWRSEHLQTAPSPVSSATARPKNRR